MVTRTVTCAQVDLVFECDDNPRIDSSMTAAQIRQTGRRPQLLAYIPLQLQPRQPTRLPTPRPNGAIWEVRFQLLTPVLHIAREFLPETSPAFRLLLEHERGHIMPWLDCLAGPQGPFVGPISQAYVMAVSASRPPSDAHLRRVIDVAINRSLRGARADLETVARRYDDSDYPQLHARLRTLGVSIP